MQRCGKSRARCCVGQTHQERHDKMDKSGMTRWTSAIKKRNGEHVAHHRFHFIAHAHCQERTEVLWLEVVQVHLSLSGFDQPRLWHVHVQCENFGGGQAVEVRHRAGDKVQDVACVQQGVVWRCGTG